MLLIFFLNRKTAAVAKKNFSPLITYSNYASFSSATDFPDWHSWLVGEPLQYLPVLDYEIASYPVWLHDYFSLLSQLLRAVNVYLLCGTEQNRVSRNLLSLSNDIPKVHSFALSTN